MCAERDEAPPFLAGVAYRPADALALVAAQQATIACLLEIAFIGLQTVQFVHKRDVVVV